MAKCDIPTHEAIFAVVYGAEEQCQTKASYFYDNVQRSTDADGLVIQRTLSGMAFIEKDGVRKMVGAGQAILFTHREPSRYGYPPEASEPYVHRYLVISPANSLRGLFERLRADFGCVIRMPEGSEATALFDEYFTRFRERSFRDRFHESELGYRLLIGLYREQVSGTQVSDPVEFGYHFLRNYFRTPLNLKEIAAKCGLSREHFSRVFTKRYGETPGRMLRRLRMEGVKSMLAATELSMEEIALANGFVSKDTFVRAYRTAYGQRPR